MKRQMSLSLTVALLTLTACSVGNPQGPAAPTEDPASRRTGITTQLPAELAAAGLELPSPQTQRNQFQVRDANGQGVANAVVLIDGERYITDEKGHINLSERLAGITAPLDGTITGPGIVGRHIQFMPGYGVKVDSADAKASMVNASSGALVSNADGTMEVSFGPGALNKDVEVRVTRVYTENPESLKALSPGWQSLTPEEVLDQSLGNYAYSLDLGDAYFMPETAVRVNFKLEKALADYIRQAEADGSFAGSNMQDLLSKDANGDYWFAMAIPTPPKPPEASALTKSYGLLAAACNTYNDPENYQEWVAHTRNAQRCDVRRDGSSAIHDPAINGGHCYYTSTKCSDFKVTEYKLETRTRYWQSSTINAKVTYRSNDSRINGNAAVGALVNFSHLGTPVRAAGTGGWTGGDGYTSVVGRQGAYGSASVSPRQANDVDAYGTSGAYNVNCGTVNLNIVKNKPNVSLPFTNKGRSLDQALPLNSTHGALNVASGGSAAVAFNSVGATTERFSVNGTKAVGAYEIDFDSSATTLRWNGNYSVPVTVWNNAKITATPVYRSNDASVPADQRPTKLWNGQGVTQASITFAHAVSQSPNRRAGRDVLSFSNAASATAWGLFAEGGNVNVSRASATSTPFTGSSAYQVANGTVAPALTANLPKMTLRIGGVQQSNNLVMTYELDGVEKTMNLPALSGGMTSFFLPIEEDANAPATHTFKVKRIEVVGSADWQVRDADFGTDFDTVSGIARNGVHTYPESLTFTAVVPK